MDEDGEGIREVLNVNIVHINTMDSGGGAAKASRLLNNSMVTLGINSRLIVLQKQTRDALTGPVGTSLWFALLHRLNVRIDSRIVYWLYRPSELWSLGLTGVGAVLRLPVVKRADVISISWVAHFLSVRMIAKMLNNRKPVVWTLYDQNAFTGGCHYSAGCDHYKEECKHCPQLRGSSWLSHRVWRRKKRLWNAKKLTVVCPSRWLADCAARSSLMHEARIEVIPSGVDVSVFRTRPKHECRRAFKLPMDKKLVLFCAGNGFSNERKGGRLLEQALIELSEQVEPAKAPEIVMLGSHDVPQTLVDKFVFHCFTFHGDDDRLARLYAACDVTAAPSLEDNLPLTVLESMACGTPCVAFRAGGMPDAIVHMQNGYLAKPFDTSDLADGIHILVMKSDPKSISASAVTTIGDKFNSEMEARAYLSLYEDLLQQNERGHGGEACC